MTALTRTFVKPVVLTPDQRRWYADARAHAEIGFTVFPEQEPHFHVLAGIEHKKKNNRWESAYGAFACCDDHATLVKHFPEHANLVRWHLCALRSGPLHYEANALYWARLARGEAEVSKIGPDPVEAFKKTVVWGAVPEADVGNPWADAVHLHAWLRERLPALMGAFKADVEAVFPALWTAAVKAESARATITKGATP